VVYITYLLFPLTACNAKRRQGVSVSEVVPNFLVAGAGRAGTTALVEGLRTHPRVFITQPKEPHFFAFHGQHLNFKGPGDDLTINRLAVTERRQYLSLFPREGAYLALGDGSISTMYYYDRSIPAVLAMNPEMRIVILLREPVERAFSNFQYMRSRGLEPHHDFLSAIESERNGERSKWHHIWHYQGLSFYASPVSAFLQQFDQKNVMIVFYDDLMRDYDRTVCQVVRFLGLDLVAGAITHAPRVNVSGTPRWRAAQRLLTITNRSSFMKAVVTATTSYRFRESVRRATLRNSTLDLGTRAELSPVFSEDLRRLSSLLGDRPKPTWLSTTGEN
jgi:hypothetical protein